MDLKQNLALTFSLDQAIEAIRQLKEPKNSSFIEQVASLIADTFKKGNKVLIAGNGGSLADAAHFAEELTGYFRTKRAALPVIALTDAAHITCVANDTDFVDVFSRGIEAYGKPGDVFIALSTSGNSKNIVQAVATAKKMGINTVAFLGKDGGALKGKALHELIISGFSFSDRVQEAHMTAMHIIIELVEMKLFPPVDSPYGHHHSREVSSKRSI